MIQYILHVMTNIISGTSMGSSISPIIAEMIMSHIIEDVVKRTNGQIKFVAVNFTCDYKILMK